MKPELKELIVREAKAYLVDTSAKVGTYAIPMGLMEASRGMSLEQILQSRASVALSDAVLGRVYGKALNYTRSRFGTEGQDGLKSYFVDTTTMIAVYLPAYAAILKGIEYFHNKEINISSACLFTAAMLATTARPFSKYILNNWRSYWGTK